MIKHIRKSSIAFALVSSLALFSGCGIDNDGGNTVPDGSVQFVGAVEIEDINASSMLPFAQAVAASKGETRDFAFGFKSVKITYNTTNQDGESIVASGLLIIPSATNEYQAQRIAAGEKPFTVSMINENHETIFTNAEAPSADVVIQDSPDMTDREKLYATMVSYAGFAAIIPDYIGYGESNDISHPYMLKEASANTSLDMIKASIYYMEQNGVAINYQLYISGYSQGGYNAMAVAQKIENEFTTVDLKAVAAMAGPHDLEDLADTVIDASHIMAYPAFLGYLANSYGYYHEDVNVTDLVLYPDSVAYNNLFDGSNDNVTIHVNLGLTDFNGTGFPGPDYGFFTHTSNELFKESFINDYQNNVNSVIRQKFIENKSYSNWTPKTKVKLIHCIDDEIIPFSMSQDAFNELNATGADVTISPIPTSVVDLYTPVSVDNPFIHGRCASVAYGTALVWFDSIRNPKEEK